MIGEWMCHLTGFLSPIPYDVIFLLIGALWFFAGWHVSKRVQERRWLRSLEKLTEPERSLVLTDAQSKRKRRAGITSLERVWQRSRRLFRRS